MSEQAAQACSGCFVGDERPEGHDPGLVPGADRSGRGARRPVRHLVGGQDARRELEARERLLERPGPAAARQLALPRAQRVARRLPALAGSGGRTTRAPRAAPPAASAAAGASANAPVTTMSSGRPLRTIRWTRSLPDPSATAPPMPGSFRRSPRRFSSAFCSDDVSCPTAISLVPPT